jgi:hypothetical protein
VQELIDTLSNPTHVHLLLNHVPTVGFGVALALALVGQMRRNDDLKRTSLVLFFLVAAVSIGTYVSGNAAQTALRGTLQEAAYPAYVVPEAIHVHEDAALLAFTVMQVTGFFAWVALWQWRRVTKLPSGYFAIVLVLAVVTFLLMARAAELGGAVHHPEIVAAAATAGGSSPAPAAAGEVGWTRTFGTTFVDGKTWVWPTLETLHFVGLSMLFTVALIVDLRLLGMMRGVSYAAVYQLLPVGMLGFGINLITGMMFFIGSPVQYVKSETFYWKIVFVILGALNVVYFLVDETVWTVKAGDDAPFSVKFAAASAIFIWAAVLFCGHMLPFLGRAF